MDDGTVDSARLTPTVHRPSSIVGRRPHPSAGEPMQDIQVSSWNDLNEILFEESWNHRLGRFRSNYAFRGMPNARFDLRTSLVQLGGDYSSHESDLLRNFRKYAYRNAAPGDS